MNEELQRFIEERSSNEKKLKVERYRRLNRFAKKGQVLFVGSSLMEQFPIDEMQRDLGLPYQIFNRGIGGFTTGELLDNIDVCILQLEPSHIFINIGTNDLNGETYDKEALLETYEKILDRILDSLPGVKITLLGYYPTNPEFGEKLIYMKEVLLNRSNARIEMANRDVQEMANRKGLRWINVNDGLHDSNGYLKEEYSIDGMHMYGDGYKVVLDNMLPYLREIQV